MKNSNIRISRGISKHNHNGHLFPKQYPNSLWQNPSFLGYLGYSILGIVETLKLLKS